MIENPEYFTAIVTLTVVLLMSAIQWSKYQEHNEKHKNDPKEEYERIAKFAFLPYFVIPLVGCALAVLGTVWLAGVIESRGWLTNPDELMLAGIGIVITLYFIVDYIVIANLGKSVFWVTIEREWFQAVDKTVKPIVEKTLNNDSVAEILSALAEQIKKK